MLFDSIHYSIKGKQLLSGVHLSIESGKIHGLFGPNGSGKSTLIRIGAGLVLPTAGTVSIGGLAFRRKNLLRRYEKIGYLSQETFLPRGMRVSAFIETLATERRQFVERRYPANLLAQKIGELSSGELRLLELIFVFSLDRMILLLDEPFTGIEPIIIDKMLALIKQQRDNGKGILLTDHYYRYIAQISDIAYFMKSGKCENLSGDTGFRDQLRRKGYLGDRLEQIKEVGK